MSSIHLSATGRVRSKTGPMIHTTYGGSPREIEQTHEYMEESSTPGSCNVFHWRCERSSGRATLQNGNFDTVENHAIPMTRVLPEILARLAQFEGMLDSSKLASSTGLNIIQSVWEFTETLEIFTKSFWRIASRRDLWNSYGAYEWGVKPLIGEITALLNLLLALEQLIGESDYETGNSVTIPDFTIPFSANTSGRVSGITSTVRHTGVVQFGDLGAAKWLDALGYYPDIATAWDLFPLSFMINWFVPVGSFLESFRRPWITHIPFHGWVTTKTSFTYDHLVHDYPYVDGRYFGSQGHLYTRHKMLDTLVVPEKIIDDLSMPSLSEMFKTVYLLGPALWSRRRRS